MSVALTILSVRLDLRLLAAASRHGRSVVYVRLDFGCRTALQYDLEYISRDSRANSVVEYLVKLGPLQNTNRSYYVG